MRTVSSHAEHHISLWPAKAPREVLAISSWDMPDGNRLIREMRRVSQLRDVAAVRRWAKKYPDVRPQDVAEAIAFLEKTQTQNPIST